MVPVKVNLCRTRFGVKKIILGLGGSATNDGGAGMMQALGLGLKR